jgi:tetratricopeptide (TPR) repeat protein
MASDEQSDRLLQKARALRQQGDYREAIEVYREVLNMDRESLEALNEVGLIHVIIGEQTLAEVAFDLAISISPYDFRAHSNKAEAHLTLGRFEEALEVAHTGLKLSPECAELWEKKARALESMMKIDEAIDAYNEAIKYDSENPETWKALALCLDAQEKWTEVARAYRIAAELHERRGESKEAESCEKFAGFAESS